MRSALRIFVLVRVNVALCLWGLAVFTLALIGR
jgi:hypothetical protein